jgi:hypothetical protein
LVNEELVHFLRQITADGVVDKQEIWDLGTFFMSTTTRGSSGRVLSFGRFCSRFSKTRS